MPSDILWHNSQLRQLRGCEQSFHYRYVEGLKPATGSHAMERGTWVHFALAAHNLGKGAEADTLLFRQETLDPRLDMVGPVTIHYNTLTMSVARFDKNYTLTAAGALALLEDHWDMLPLEVTEDNDLPGETRALVERYLFEYRDEAYDVLGVEVDWRRRNEISGVWHSGAIDLVKAQRGMVVVTDHKTHASLPDATYRLTDSQLHLYAWGVEEMLLEHGLKADAVEFDYLITRKPVEIQWTKPTKKNPVTRLYATVVKSDAVDEIALTRGIRERKEELPALSADLGVEVTINEEQVAETLQKVIERGSPFFTRSLMPKSSAVIDTLLEEMSATAARGEEILRTDAFPTRTVDFMGCRRCPYVNVCSGDLYGNDTTLIKDEFIDGTIHTLSGDVTCKGASWKN